MRCLVIAGIVTSALCLCSCLSPVAPQPIANPAPLVALEAASSPAAETTLHDAVKPMPAFMQQHFSVVVQEVPVKEILFALARDNQLNMDIDPAIDGKATLHALDQPLHRILQRLANQSDISYRLDEDVLSIRPDRPVVRHYAVDYLNLSRDTSLSVGAASEIATTGSATGRTSTLPASSNANGSRTQVASSSRHHFWESLLRNVQSLLGEHVAERSTSAPVSAPAPAIPGMPTSGATISNLAEQRPAVADSTGSKTPRTNVIANTETGILSVRATEKQHKKVAALLGRIMQSARRQVMIEASIVEVELRDAFQAGIDWSRIAQGGEDSGLFIRQSLRPGITDPSAPSPNSQFRAGYTYTGSGILANLSAAITLLQQFGTTRVLSSPRLRVLNNQTAVLKVVDNLVYFTIEAQTSQTQTNLNTVFTTTPHTVPVGVVMSVTPHISSTQQVMLNVRPTISRFVRDVQDPNPSLVVNGNRIASSIPIIQVREMESLLHVSSGETAILGGLMQDEQRDNRDQVPGLHRLPLLGKLFTGKAELQKKSELVIFLRPVVVSEPAPAVLTGQQPASFPDTDEDDLLHATF
ncbi:pilus (MSHA type) biogenesis protein MshL [Methylobacillus flagellatus]|uniref:pilus (MSHA type) biogenesis protein MshL n=1 Tax=Methylobacillus flagellatus TaxID=405 RepID=UPI0010F66B20|nr:pilus (MSHA type) biogenesis protein MshL [Methylobacillus flagellatus]